MNSFLGPFLMGFATCGGLVLLLGVGIWLGAQIVTRIATKKKETTPEG